MKKSIILSAIGLLLLAFGCEKPEAGYLSDNIFYNTNPFNVAKGITTYSKPIVGNGSTTLLNVELLKVKNEAGEDVTEAFTKPGNIVVFKDAINYKDSTLALLHEKLKDSLVTPFNVNYIGGRLEFSAATSYVAGGEYDIDVEVSNIKGTSVIENACKIILEKRDPLDTYNMNYKRIATPSTGELKLSETNDANITVDVEYIPGAENGSKCIYKFLDKNGDAFNPLTGQVTRRADDFPFFDTWNPWYPVVKTDTAFEQEMPNYEGVMFPYFTEFKLGDRNWVDISARYDWKIPAGNIEEIDEDLHGLISFDFSATGTFIITTQMHKLTRK
ncbi:hypothetical protein [Thalassobellus citreus]|uniref:hypothetical protein n=1 Tax=Thalassobellus citreus TaxID=3367752 RepID=UPI00379601EA